MNDCCFHVYGMQGKSYSIDDDGDDNEDDDELFMRNDWPLKVLNRLSFNPTKWSKTLTQFVGFCKQIVCVCLTILWCWRLKGWALFPVGTIFRDSPHHKQPLISCEQDLNLCKTWIQALLNEVVP